MIKPAEEFFRQARKMSRRRSIHYVERQLTTHDVKRKAPTDVSTSRGAKFRTVPPCILLSACNVCHTRLTNDFISRIPGRELAISTSPCTSRRLSVEDICRLLPFITFTKM